VLSQGTLLLREGGDATIYLSYLNGHADEASVKGHHPHLFETCVPYKLNKGSKIPSNILKEFEFGGTGPEFIMPIDFVKTKCPKPFPGVILAIRNSSDDFELDKIGSNIVFISGNRGAIHRR
jgi:hypothetical protein